MEYLRSILLVATTAVTLSACATDVQSPEYDAGGLPDEIAAQILFEYKQFLPDDWERGTITVESCSEKKLMLCATISLSTIQTRAILVRTSSFSQQELDCQFRHFGHFQMRVHLNVSNNAT